MEGEGGRWGEELMEVGNGERVACQPLSQCGVPTLVTEWNANLRGTSRLSCVNIPRRCPLWLLQCGPGFGPTVTEQGRGRTDRMTESLMGNVTV